MKAQHGEIKYLSSLESIKLLESGRLAHLACHVNEEIYVVPITYAFEDGYIYSHSEMGKKIEMMRKNPKICIQVEEVQDFFRWKSVIAWGNFEELKEDAATRGAQLLIKKITEKESSKHASSTLAADLTGLLETAIIFRMKIQQSTGRYEA